MDKQKALETIGRKKIGVLMGGLSEEREVSLKTGAAVLSSLERMGVDAVGMDAGRDIAFRLKDEAVDMAFIALHGRYGEDGCVQGMLEVMGVPYTGAGVAGSAIAMSKVLTKDILKSRGVATPDHVVVHKKGYGGSAGAAGMRAPVVVKPASGGSSINVSICLSDDEISPAIERAFDSGPEVIVERWVDGTLITVGIVGGKALPAIEIEAKEGFYDYRNKYTPGSTEYHIPARLDGATLDEAARMTMEVHEALGCAGVSRSEIIVDRAGKPWFIELNTIPGMTETSLLPKAAAHVGLTFDDLVMEILVEAVERQEG